MTDISHLCLPPTPGLQGQVACGTQLPDRIAARMKLHGNYTCVVQFCQLAENVLIVDFTRPRLMTAWNVRDVHETQIREALSKLFDEITACNLLVIEVVKQPNLQMVGCLNNFKSLGDLREEVFRVFLGINSF